MSEPTSSELTDKERIYLSPDDNFWCCELPTGDVFFFQMEEEARNCLKAYRKGHDDAYTCIDCGDKNFVHAIKCEACFEKTAQDWCKTEGWKSPEEWKKIIHAYEENNQEWLEVIDQHRQIHQEADKKIADLEAELNERCQPCKALAVARQQKKEGRK